jgi:putative component of membrane protein insertase Oxa1/YidC/SpoIIIJ protein YidD
MATRTVEALTTRAAIAAIRAYRTHLSPRKGFACPHRLLYGGPSCSDYVETLLGRRSLRTAIALAPNRFRACQAAAHTLAYRNLPQAGCVVIPCCIPL